MVSFQLKAVFHQVINWLFISQLLMACQPEKQQDSLPFYNTPQFDAEWISPSEKAYSNIHTIDTFAFKNQANQLITKDSLDGKIYVANFFFSICPSICPTMMTNLSTLQSKYASNNAIRLVSFSVMPWVDSVAKLKQYGQERHINPSKWHLLTGNKERIYTLARQSYFAEKGLGIQKKGNGFLHTESMLLIDRKGRIRGIYNATQVADIERISEDIETLLQE